MSRTRDVYCPNCDHNFPVARDEGDTAACPQCCHEFDVEWSDDEEGESVRLMPQIAMLPPTGTVEAVMTAVEHAMFSQMGIPAHLVGSELPSSVDLRPAVDADRFYTYIKKPDMLDDHWECDGVRPSIIVQAQWMGMRVFNNRKRMRKRVRQRRRHWSPYDDHWSQHPGDW